MQDPIRIGILHSLQGPMAICESAMVDAALLAVEEINARGGLLGRPLQATIADGESDPAVFQNQARKLIRSDKAQALFGCWTSSARKAVKTVVEDEDSLLWYPVQYEGLEQSPNIVYTGSCLNQQVQPFIEWCLAQGWKRFFLVGSEYVFPHTVNKLIHSLLHGVDAQVVGEKYFPLDCDDFAVLLPLLREAEPDIIINTVNGSANFRLFEQVFSSPLVPERLQAFSSSCTEIDYARIGKPAHGHLSCWSYFQSLQNQENEMFIAKYRARFGHDRLVSDPIVTAYAQVHLWAAVVAARKTFSPVELKDQLAGQSIESPLGRLEVRANNHVARKALIGRYTALGRHDILWQTQDYIQPLPWMGMEEVEITSRALILDLLKKIPDEIDTGIRLQNEIDERRRAEQELRKKNEELELYFASSLDLLCIADIDGQFVRLNPEWENVLGYSVSELQGRMFLDFVHPEDVESTVAAVSRLEKQEDVLNFVNRFRCKDGAYRWLEWRSKPMGRQIYAVARDITRRRTMKEALQKSEETFRNIVQSSPMGIHLYRLQEDDALILTVANPAADRLLGLDHTTFVGKTIEQAFPPLQATEVPERYRRAARHGENWYTEQVEYDHDGISGAFEVHAFQMSPGNVAVLFNDITERKLTEQALRESQTTFRDLFEKSADAILLIDQSRVFVECNQAALNLLKMSRDEFMNRSPALISPEYQPNGLRSDEAAQDMIDQAYAKGLHRFDWTCVNSEGDEFIVDVSLMPILIKGQTMLHTTWRDITERKQAETRLQQSEENLARTLESIGDGVIATDRQGRVVRMNPVAEKLCGWSESEAEGRVLGEVFRIVNAVTREHLEDPVHKVFATGQVVGLANHTLLLSKSGEEFQIADSAAPIKDRDGNITGAVLVFRDVTQEYARDKVIKEEREQLLSIFNSIEGMIYISDPQTYEVLYVNNKLAALLPRDCIGSRCYEAFQGLEAPCGFCTNHIILGNNNQPHQWEYYNPTLDRYFSIVDRIIKWPDGRNVRFEMAIDITERKRVEEALLESEEMQRKLLQAVSDLIIRTDLEGTITFVNELAFPGLGNVPEKSILGRNIFSLIDKDDLPRAVENARQRLERNIGPQEYRLQFDDGTVLDAEVNGAVIRDRHAEAIGIVYVIRDISERKRALKEQEKLHGQFLQAQKMQSLGVLAGGVAHDFNNLLQTMSGNIELLLRDKPKDHPDAKRLQTVTQSMDRAGQLVEQLLFFSRKSGSRRVRVNLNQEVERVCRMLERTIPKMIALELHLEPSVWPLFADPVQIEQILLNLAGNALDAMHEGGRLSMKTDNIVLHENFVKMHPGASEGRHVLLTVSDTGCGMDKETLAHIFEPFFTTKDVGKGTGLGLASVYGIVQAHGGYIQCRSEPNQGAAFRLYLPAGELVDEVTEEPPPEAAPQGGNETILVVDDEPEIRDLTREALESLGYMVKSAATGEEALEIFTDDGQNIDLVLLDLNMPGTGGHKCLQELQRLDPKVKVVIASGYSASGHGRDAVSSGAKGFIGKPYQLKNLAAMVRGVLDG